MKKLIFMLINLFSVLNLSAQDSSKLNVRQFFTHLNTSDLSTDRLGDYILPLSGLQYFTGLYDTVNTYNNWKQIYYEMYHAAIDYSDLTSIGVIDSMAWEIRKKDTLVLGIIDYQYDKLKYYAVDSNLIVYDSVNGYYSDVTGRTENPYFTANVFTASILTDHIYNKTYKVYIGSDFYFSNFTSYPTNIRIDFDDGLGYRNITLGEYYDVTYSDTGSKIIKVKADRDDTTLTAQTQIYINFKKDSEGDTYGFIPSSGLFHSAGYWTRRSPIDPNTSQQRECIKNPVIILDGIDFGNKGMDADHYRSGDLGWEDLIHPNYSRPDLKNYYPEFRYMPDFITSLISADYDVFFLDNYDGADYIERNAMLLVELINFINNNKCSCAEIVVMGPSMGGQVAKYALAYMEKHGIEHKVRLYISLDSPHQGANIPIGAQRFLDYFKEQSNDARDAIDNKLTRPAARELLIYHFQWSDNADLQAFPTRATFLENLNNLGNYPQKLRRIAAINGSKTATQLYSDRDKILGYHWSGVLPMANCTIWSLSGMFASFWFIPVAIDGHIWAVPGTTSFKNKTDVIWYGDLPIQKYNALTCPVTYRRYDNWAGSTNNALKAFGGKQYTNCGQSLGEINIYHESNTFIPSVSGLDIGTNPFQPHTAPFITGIDEDVDYNIKVNIQNTNKPNITKYPFEAYYAPLNENQIHVQVDNPTDPNGNTAWLLNQMELNKPDNITYLPNSSGNIYNFGSTKRTVNSVTINSSGKLQINGNYKTAYGTIDDPLPFYTNFDVHTPGAHTWQGGSCNTQIIINSGGQLIVGEFGGTNTGTLTIKNGDKLILNGGTITVYNHSRIIIEKGGELVFNGGTLNLLGNDAFIEFKGNLHLSANTNFSLSSASTGYLRFYQDRQTGTVKNVIVDNNNCTMTLNHNNTSSLVLQVDGGESFYPDDNLKMLNIHDAQVQLGNNCRLNIGCPFTMDKVEINSIPEGGNYSNNNHRGLNFYGQNIAGVSQVSLTDLTIKNGLYGIYGAFYFGNNGGVGPVNNNITISGCKNCIYTSGGHFTLNNAHLSCENDGWKAEYTNGDCKIFQTKIDKSNSSNNYKGYGFYMSTGLSTARQWVEQSNIQYYSVGSCGLAPDMFVKCSRINHNDTGLYVNDPGAWMVATTTTTPGPTGNNDFTNNIHAIELNSFGIDIENGYNDMANCTYAIHGNIYYSGYCPSSSIMATHNRWNAGGGINSSDYNVNFPVCTAPNPVFTDLFASSNSPINCTYTGPLSPPMNSEANTIGSRGIDSSFTSALDSAKEASDKEEYLTAVRILFKTLKNNTNLKTRNNSLQGIYRQMMRYYLNSVQNQEINIAKSNNGISDSILQLQSLMYKGKEKDLVLFGNQLLRDRVGLFQLLRLTDSAMNELDILKKKDIKNINYLERWHCILAAEDSVLKGKAKREDFYRLVKDCSGDTILNSPINKQVAETSIPMPTEVRSNFKLYPDPAYNLINIEFIADKNVNANIRIFNIAGKMLYEQKSCRFNNENTLKTISLEGFASGLYIMQIETQNKVLREKFIIHR